MLVNEWRDSVPRQAGLCYKVRLRGARIGAVSHTRIIQARPGARYRSINERFRVCRRRFAEA